MSTSLQCVLRSDVARLYRRISKRLAVETTSLYCSCFITPSHHSCSLAWPDPHRKREGLATPDYRSCSSLLKSTHAISIDFAEMHADHIVSSGSPHNNVLHFSSYITAGALKLRAIFNFRHSSCATYVRDAASPRRSCKQGTWPSLRACAHVHSCRKTGRLSPPHHWA